MNQYPTSRRGISAILIFITLYISLQLFLVFKTHFQEDKKFGFWMFPEDSFFQAVLFRELEDGTREKVHGGFWRTPSGQRYKWHEFVSDDKLDHLNIATRSNGNLSTTIRYFQEALNFVAERIPEDRETRKLVIRLQYRRANGEWEEIFLESRERAL